MGQIAARYGIRDWRALYELPDNAAFRRRCPNPDLLVPGAELMVPERPPDQRVVRRTGAAHTFVVYRAPYRLRLRLHDVRGEPLEGWRYRLEVGDEVCEGELGNAGLLDVPLAPPVGHGRLAVWPVDVEPPPEEDWVELAIGGLHEPASTTGIQARLANLGLYEGEVDGDLETEASVAALKLLGAKAKDPAVALVEKYGC